MDLDSERLDDTLPSGNRTADHLFGIVLHDAYHVAQIQLIKRLYTDLNKNCKWRWVLRDFSVVYSISVAKSLDYFDCPYVYRVRFTR